MASVGVDNPRKKVRRPAAIEGLLFIAAGVGCAMLVDWMLARVWPFLFAAIAAIAVFVVFAMRAALSFDDHERQAQSQQSA